MTFYPTDEDVADYIDDVGECGNYSPEAMAAARKVLAAGRYAAEREAVWADRIAGKQAREAAAAKKAERESKWTPLDGSPAQQRWAAEIRSKRMEGLDLAAAKLAEQNGNSRFWIDNKDAQTFVLVRLLSENKIAREAPKAPSPKAPRAKAKPTKKSIEATAKRAVQTLEYLLTLKAQFVEVPAPPASRSYGDAAMGKIEHDGQLFRFFHEGEGLLRVIAGDVSGRGVKVNYTLAVTEEMRAGLALI